MSPNDLISSSFTAVADNKESRMGPTASSPAGPTDTNSYNVNPPSNLSLASIRKRNAIGIDSSSSPKNIAQEQLDQGFPNRTSIEPPNVEPRKRTTTAPAASSKPGTATDGKLPQLLRSRTSWLSGKGKGNQTSNPDGFPFQFEPFSDSDLSGSSLDESSCESNYPQKKQEKISHVNKKGNGHDKVLRRESNSEDYDRFNIGNGHFRTKGKVNKRDGRLKITVNEAINSGYLARTLGAGLRHHLDLPGHRKHAGDQQPNQQPSTDGVISSLVSNTLGGPYMADEDLSSPKLNVVIIVIGSRGDIQPFLKIGKVLKEHHGHRVRIATHPAFKGFVEQDSGLEFFSVGGDPSELMAFMVKNPGLIPSLETVKQGEIGRRRKAMYEMFLGMWHACTCATDEIEKDKSKTVHEKSPFVADAIIANPPSFAHIHIAERLGIPLHMMFTFPYSPTTAFPHPLASIKNGNVDARYTNFMSYPLVELMTWQGLGDLANKFRTETLGLDPVSTIWAPGQLYRFKVPYTYLWSPSLVPKPSDWGPEIDIGGFVFLEQAQSFEPPVELTDFINAGDPPIYIGFGSIVVDDPESFTRLIFEAVQKAGVRALVSKGWGGIGGEGNDVPDSVFMLGNTPHDWLFPKCVAVVHHGGAGTTAIGLKCGKPTMIVPFFGDQPFWGSMVAGAGAGSRKCIPYKKLTAEKLAQGIIECLSDEARQNVKQMADGIAKEGDGALNAVKSFQRHLPVGRQGQSADMRCEILQDRVAIWRVKDKKRGMNLSALAAEILVEKKKLRWNQLKLVRHYEWNDFEGPPGPVSGVGSAVGGTAAGLADGISTLPLGVAKTTKARAKHEKKRRRLERKKKRDEYQRKGNEKEGADTDVAGSGEGVTAVDQQKNSEPDKHSPQEGPSKEPNTIPNINPEQAIRTDLDRSDSHHQDVSRPPGALSSPSNETRSIDRPVGRTTTGGLDGSSNPGSPLSAGPSEALPTEIVGLTGEAALQTASSVAAFPIDLAIAVAQGFHNAPRLYGDETVRRPPRITGWRSGMRAARTEFGYGIRDGWTGLVSQPRMGLRKGFSGDSAGPADKALGGLEGLGKGLGGFVLKDVSAVAGPLAFVAQGLRKEILKGKQPTGRLRQARIAEGRRERRAKGNKEKIGDQEKTQDQDNELDDQLERDVLNAWSLQGDIGPGKKSKGKVNPRTEDEHDVDAKDMREQKRSLVTE